MRSVDAIELHVKCMEDDDAVSSSTKKKKKTCVFKYQFPANLKLRAISILSHPFIFLRSKQRLFKEM